MSAQDAGASGWKADAEGTRPLEKVAGPGRWSKASSPDGGPRLLPLLSHPPIFFPVHCQRLVLVGDAHLGRGASASEESLLAFLRAVPSLGDGLAVTGDLFEFWFAYSRTIPRSGIRVVAALTELRRTLPILMVGGNHDRWAESFWEEIDIEFQPREGRVRLGETTALVVHGDGITESHWSARALHRITSSAATVGLFRAIHPDLGFWLVDHLSTVLGDTTRLPAALDAAAERQRAWALSRLAEDPSLGLVAMGHTHRAATAEVAPGRLYVNPGSWCDGQRYAVVTEGRAALTSFVG